MSSLVLCLMLHYRTAKRCEKTQQTAAGDVARSECVQSFHDIYEVEKQSSEISLGLKQYVGFIWTLRWWKKKETLCGGTQKKTTVQLTFTEEELWDWNTNDSDLHLKQQPAHHKLNIRFICGWRWPGSESQAQPVRFFLCIYLVRSPTSCALKHNQSSFPIDIKTRHYTCGVMRNDRTAALQKSVKLICVVKMTDVFWAFKITR